MEVALPSVLRHPVIRRRTHLVVVLSSLVVVGSFVWVPMLSSFIAQRCRKSKKRLAALFAFLLFLVYWPLRPWPGARDWSLWEHWTQYFSPRVILDGKFSLEDRRPKLFAFMPHGLYPMGAAIALVGDLSRQVFGSLRVAVADAARRVPIYRHLLGWIGDLGASSNAIVSTLKSGKSVQLLPGGTAEMYHTSPSTESLVLSQRKGFIRTAIQAGAPIVPVYVFGSSDVFTIFPLTDKLQWLGRLMRVSLIGLYGRGYLPIPYSVPLMYVVGSPIEVGPAVATPSPQQIDQLHAIFVAAVQMLFERYKNVYGRGYGSKALKIL